MKSCPFSLSLVKQQKVGHNQVSILCFLGLGGEPHACAYRAYLVGVLGSLWFAAEFFSNHIIFLRSKPHETKHTDFKRRLTLTVLKKLLDPPFDPAVNVRKNTPGGSHVEATRVRSASARLKCCRKLLCAAEIGFTWVGGTKLRQQIFWSN